MQKTTIITCNSLKGGVGKTSLTRGLAYSLTTLKYRVGVIDLDYSNNLTNGYADDCIYDLIDTDKSLDVLKHVAETSNYDFILIDTAPSLVKETLSAYIISDYLLIPTTLARDSIEGIKPTFESIQSIKEINPKLKLLGVVISNYDKRDNTADECLATLKTAYSGILLNSMIRVSSMIKKAKDNAVDIQEYEKSFWMKKATPDFDNLAKEIIKKIK
jgi:cellulose biosynthesis protein BcsQ